MTSAADHRLRAFALSTGGSTCFGQGTLCELGAGRAGGLCGFEQSFKVAQIPARVRPYGASHEGCDQAKPAVCSHPDAQRDVRAGWGADDSVTTAERDWTAIDGGERRGATCPVYLNQLDEVRIVPAGRSALLSIDRSALARAAGDQLAKSEVMPPSHIIREV